MSEIEPKSPEQYKKEIDKYIGMIDKCFSLEGHAKKCEEVLMKKLTEVYKLINSTKDYRYKEVYVQGIKDYTEIIDKEDSKNERLSKSLIDLMEIESDSTMLHPEEIEESILMWRKSVGIL